MGIEVNEFVGTKEVTLAPSTSASPTSYPATSRTMSPIASSTERPTKNPTKSFTKKKKNPAKSPTKKKKNVVQIKMHNFFQTQAVHTNQMTLKIRHQKI